MAPLFGIFSLLPLIFCSVCFKGTVLVAHDSEQRNQNLIVYNGRLNMADGRRRLKFLKAFFCLIVFSMPLDSPTEGAEFLPNLENIAVYEGHQKIIMNLTAGPNNVSWLIIPTSDEFGSYQILEYDVYNYSLAGLFYANQSGLVILNATIVPNEEDPISTSGVYIADLKNSDNRIAAKLLVVRAPPVCLCNASSSNASQLSCSTIYADGTLHPINANMTWKIGDVVYTTDTPVRNRIDYYVYESTSTITVDNSVPDNFTCTVAFNAPTDIVYDFIATNAPEFSACCSVEVCVNGTTQTTTQRPTEITTTTNTATPTTTVTSRSTTQSVSDIGGGLSDGGKIGIGVGIGVGGTLVLVGILFAVLCRRYEWTKRTKTDDEITKGKTDDSDRNKIDISETSQYQQLQNLSTNPVPTYERLTSSTDVDATEESLSCRTTYEDIGHKLKANESYSTEYEGLQQRELPAPDAYESIKQMS